ncbi:hypothetical protein CDAR_310341 [Caerostris darwini]|uniref:Uncharacterized protein n=1 Tax=Caerostris darwini TaxID=1538125 RepID=A0AAV4TMY7_9ARAC|nr:hypothetical protein CDAR_310341 [Caerostris darwini]
MEILRDLILNPNFAMVLLLCLACLPDLMLEKNTATTNESAPSVLKRDIELMLHENVLRDRINQIYRSNDLDSSFKNWMCSVVGKILHSTSKMAWIND